MSVPKSYIKNIALQISNDYKLDNAPYSVNVKNDIHEKKSIPFIGRVQQQAKFLEFFRGNPKRGVFLVTGYRGMGKTSFVNHVIRNYREKDENGLDRTKDAKHRIIPIHLTLAQNKPKEIEILRLLVSSVHDRYRIYRNRGWDYDELTVDKHWIYKYKSVLTRGNLINASFKTKFLGLKLLLLPLLFIVATAVFLKYQLPDAFNQAWVEVVILSLLFIYILSFISLKFLVFLAEKRNSPNNRIKRLLDSCYAISSEETNNGEEFILPLIKSRFNNSEKRSKQYPIAETKQIEYELQEFLAIVRQEEHLDFIFIFDELDKVDPVISSPHLYEDMESFENKKVESSYEKDIRERKQAIISIIASLKNFFTTAHARFIFVAGREMFDASLADIADRQSSISSIFTYVFNIESLLKEVELSVGPQQDGVTNASLSNAIEAYLKAVLFQKNADDRDKNLYQTAQDCYGDQDFDKVYFTLQNFITYLTYRSNGSPQKLIKAIHEFIRVEKCLEEDEKTIFCTQRCTPNSNLYLYFNYHDQYRIGFINYLYRPFLIRHGRKFKHYSDNIIVSTPYLFDHLLKFHPFAFSLSNLEMIPEVLSTNKTPSLREHIKQIIEHLGANHIRETELSLFDYKFYSKTLNEITYLSKIFEPEAAAFNFTLDETYLIKLHVRNKIKELRSIYSKFLGNSEASKQQIFSIAHLNETLGDLNFFDQEYDDAIVAYSDAIKPINQLDVEWMDMQDFITLIKNKLKLGLCFEKTSSYEEALALYSDCCQDAKKFMVNRLLKGQPVHVPYPKNDQELNPLLRNKSYKEIIFYSSALSDILQIVLQGFLSKIFIQEKMGVEGISDLKLNIALGSFLKIAGGFVEPENRNHLLKANAYLFTGKLLYFKNSQIGFQLTPELNSKEKILPDNFFQQITQLAWRNEHLFHDKPLQKRLWDRLKGLLVNNEDKEPSLGIQRKPVIALYLYIFSLYEVISAKYMQSKLVVEMNGYITSSGLAANDKANVVRTLLGDVQEILKHTDESLRAIHYRYMATLLSNIGDCLLSMYKVNIKDKGYNSLIITDIFNGLDDKADFKKYDFCYFLKDSAQDSFDLTDVLKLYYLSGQFFFKYGRKVSCSFQYNKILYVLRMVLSKEPDHKDIYVIKFLQLIKTFLVTPVLQIASTNSGNSDTHMVKKADKYGIKQGFALNNLSYHSEAREVILLYHYLEIKIGKTDQNIDSLVSSNNTISTQYARLKELDFYAKYVYESKLSAIFTEQFNKTQSYYDDEIINYLFTRLSMLRILDIYSNDYALGFRYHAYTHFRVAEFLKRCEGLLDIRPIAEKKLNELLGQGSFASLDYLYHYQRAGELYEKTIQLHTAGGEYKKMVSDMIYLEDDFNDNAYHFGAALDRYLIINGVLADRVITCKNMIDSAAMYQVDAYAKND